MKEKHSIALHYGMKAVGDSIGVQAYQNALEILSLIIKLAKQPDDFKCLNQLINQILLAVKTERTKATHVDQSFYLNFIRSIDAIRNVRHSKVTKDQKQYNYSQNQMNQGHRSSLTNSFSNSMPSTLLLQFRALSKSTKMNINTTSGNNNNQSISSNHEPSENDILDRDIDMIVERKSSKNHSGHTHSHSNNNAASHMQTRNRRRLSNEPNNIATGAMSLIRTHSRSRLFDNSTPIEMTNNRMTRPSSFISFNGIANYNNTIKGVGGGGSKDSPTRMERLKEMSISNIHGGGNLSGSSSSRKTLLTQLATSTVHAFGGNVSGGGSIGINDKQTPTSDSYRNNSTLNDINRSSNSTQMSSATVTTSATNMSPIPINHITNNNIPNTAHSSSENDALNDQSLMNKSNEQSELRNESLLPNNLYDFHSLSQQEQHQQEQIKRNELELEISHPVNNSHIWLNYMSKSIHRLFAIKSPIQHKKYKYNNTQVVPINQDDSVVDIDNTVSSNH